MLRPFGRCVVGNSISPIPLRSSTLCRTYKRDLISTSSPLRVLSPTLSRNTLKSTTVYSISGEGVGYGRKWSGKRNTEAEESERPEGWTALHWAAAQLNGAGEVATLLSQGAPIECRTPVGNTPLGIAALNGCVATVALLLRAGANPFSQDHDGLTPLHWAALKNHPQVVRTLRRHASALSEVRDSNGLTALHRAAIEGAVEGVKALLQNGDSLSPQDKFPKETDGRDGWTPLHYAASGGHGSVVRLLLSLGADRSVVSSQADGKRTAADVATEDLVDLFEEDIPRINLRGNLLSGEVQELVGLRTFKEFLERLSATVHLDNFRQYNHGVPVSSFDLMNFLFVGNPGTGKRMAAELLAKELWHLSHGSQGPPPPFISIVHPVTVPELEARIQEAVGGTLYLPLLPYLAQESAIIPTLLQKVDEYGKSLTVILSGYSSDVGGLLKVFPGIRARFPMKVTFEDYSHNEMAQIIEKMAHRKGLVLEAGLLNRLPRLISDTSLQSDAREGNARMAQHLLQRAIFNQAGLLLRLLIAVRLKDIYGKSSKEELLTLSAVDFDLQAHAEEELGGTLSELDAFIGHPNVKRFVHTLYASTLVQQRRRAVGLPFVSWDFTHSQTTQKTTDVVNSAMGGVLFIDEAYSLVTDERDTYGLEVLTTLPQMMEEYREDLVVILAGYPLQMRELLATNPGLESRFPNLLEFRDYTPQELQLIGAQMMAKEDYELTPAALKKLNQMIETVGNSQHGNARDIRNLIEKIVAQQNLRIIEQSQPSTVTELRIIREEDVY